MGIRILLLLVSFLPSLSAFSADLYWTRGGTTGTQYPSADAACEAYNDYNGYSGWKFKYHQAAGDPQMRTCIGDYYQYGSLWSVNTSSPYNNSYYAWRNGSTCPGGKQFDTATATCVCPSGTVESGGQCVPDNPCADKSGTIATSVENMGQEFPITIGATVISACVAGCSVPMATQVKCSTSAKTWDTFCLFKGVYDGNQCDASPGADPSPCVGDSCVAPTPTIDTETTPCVYVEDAEGRKVCSSTTATYNDGSQNCGTVGTSLECFPKVPPKSDTTEIDTTVKTDTNPDGSTTTTKTDTATSSQCSGPNSCTSTTTTTTTVISKSPSGETTGTTTSCTGDKCQGDGDGEGDTGNCPPGEECAVPGTGAQDWHTPGDDTMSSVLGDYASRMQSAPFMTAASGFFTISPSGSCPVWSVDAWVFHIVIDQQCSSDMPWGLIKAIVLACAGFVAFRWALL